MSSSRTRDDEQQCVLFEIDIESSHSSHIIFADISNRSAFPNENEILFDIGATFEIITVSYDIERHIWRIHMRTSAEVLPIYLDYEHYIYGRMKETNVNILLGILLTDMREYKQSLKYFKYILVRMFHNHKYRANIYYSMSRAYRFIGKNHLALKFLRRAKHIQSIKQLKSYFDLARTFAGLGSVYYEFHDY
ncbi:unnamed protein product [Rotaria sp. Silwood1]|nr:unnamed protein product [Rotaria sp. Silwood1]